MISSAYFFHFFFFFFNDTATTEIYTLSLHDALPIEFAVTQVAPQPPQPPAGSVTLPPTGNVQACPTKADAWKAGDNQPIADAPAYDCNTFHFAGAISADAKTMTFLVDGAAD